MSKELVIKIKWGALGDHLCYSPIPRVAKETFGYDKVYISNFSDYINPNTKRLVWELNPFVDGFVDVDKPHPTFSEVPDGWNILDAVVQFCGLPDDGIRFREPEIYYKPKILPKYSNAVIFEPNHGNQRGIPLRQNVDAYFKTLPVPITHQMIELRGTRNYDKSMKIVGMPHFKAHDLEHFCDIIFSCKAFYCFTSGVLSLAAALGKPAVVMYRDQSDGILPMFHHSKLHTYVKL